jgi:hypothetical protein
MSLTTIRLPPFSSAAGINGGRDNLAISGVAVLDMSLAIPLASKNLPTGATLPLMTHLRPPFDSKVDAHRLCPFLVLVTFFDPILKGIFQKYKLYDSSIRRAQFLHIEENIYRIFRRYYRPFCPDCSQSTVRRFYWLRRIRTPSSQLLPIGPLPSSLSGELCSVHCWWRGFSRDV